MELIRIHHRPIGSLDPAEHCLDFRFGSAIRSPLSELSLELGQNGFNDSKRKAPRFFLHELAPPKVDLWNLHDRMKAGELILYEKRGEDEVNVTHSAINKIKELISGIERALLDE